MFSLAEWENLVKWLQGLSTHLLRLVKDLGQSENELLGKPDDEQHSPDRSVNSQSDGQKEEVDTPLHGSTSPLPAPPPSPRGEEDGSRSEEKQLAELEKLVPFQEKESEEEEEGPVLLNSENPNKSEELCPARKNLSEKASYSEDSSAEKIHENLIWEDGGKTTVSPNPEEVGVEHLQMMPAPETQGEIKGTLDETKRETCNLLRKLETINGDFDPKLRNDGIEQSLEESSGRAEDLQESRSAVPWIEMLEEEKDECRKE